MKNMIRMLAGMALAALMFQPRVLVASKEGDKKKEELSSFMEKNSNKELNSENIKWFKEKIISGKEFINVKFEPNDHTPFTWAIDNNLPDVVSTMLVYGADPNKTGPSYQYPLALAAESYIRTGKDGYKVIFETLLKNSADPKNFNLLEMDTAEPIKGKRAEALGSILNAAPETNFLKNKEIDKEIDDEIID